MVAFSLIFPPHLLLLFASLLGSLYMDGHILAAVSFEPFLYVLNLYEYILCLILKLNMK